MSASVHHQPWVEKYRPKTISDLCSQEEVSSVLATTLETKNLPHLLFYGPPGTGKTSSALALAKQLYGAEFKSRVLELNASDERGIQVVREKIKTFARIAVATKPGLPPFKLIILDEADSMTNDAQSALRRTMERFSKVTRFCLICNYVSRIIEPLASRCAKFRFKALDSEACVDRLRFISNSENLNLSTNVLEKIISLSFGDLRRAVMFLQTVSKLSIVSPEDLDDIAGTVPIEVLHKFVETCRRAGILEIEKVVSDMLYDGYSGFQIIFQLHEYLLQEPTIGQREKCKISLKLGEVEKKLKDGASPLLQLLDLGASMNQVFIK